MIERVAEARVPTEYGEFNAISYTSLVDRYEHVALVKGDIETANVILVRVHSECLTGDVFSSKSYKLTTKSLLISASEMTTFDYIALSERTKQVESK